VNDPDPVVAAGIAWGHWLSASAGPWVSARTIAAAEAELRAAMDPPGAHEYLATTLGITIWHLVELLPTDDPWRRLDVVDGEVLHPTTGLRFTGGPLDQRDVDPGLLIISDDPDGTLDGVAGALVDTGPSPAVGLLIRAAVHGWGGPAAMLAGSRPGLAKNAGTSAVRLLAWRLDVLGLAPPTLAIDLAWHAMADAARIVERDPVSADEMTATRWAVAMSHRFRS
jgi:hypothetical protein